MLSLNKIKKTIKKYNVSLKRKHQYVFETSDGYDCCAIGVIALTLFDPTELRKKNTDQLFQMVKEALDLDSDQVSAIEDGFENFSHKFNEKYRAQYELGAKLALMAV